MATQCWWFSTTIHSSNYCRLILTERKQPATLLAIIIWPLSKVIQIFLLTLNWHSIIRISSQCQLIYLYTFDPDICRFYMVNVIFATCSYLSYSNSLVYVSYLLYHLLCLHNLFTSPTVVVPGKVSSMGQIDLFENY